VHLATSSSTTLEFLNEDQPTDNSNGLDNVVVPSGSVVSTPEPCTLLLQPRTTIPLHGTIWARWYASKILELRHRWNAAQECYEKVKQLGLNVAAPNPPAESV
jgi:hypothetical protein